MITDGKVTTDKNAKALKEVEYVRTAVGGWT
jgi:hypothetical protein